MVGQLPGPDEVFRNTLAHIDRCGVYEKVCVHCGMVVGGKLAAFGEPTYEDLEHAICPTCYREENRYTYHGGDHIKTRFIPGSEGN